MKKPSSSLFRLHRLVGIIGCLMFHPGLQAQYNLTWSSPPSYTSKNNAHSIAAGDNYIHVVHTEGQPASEQVYYIRSADKGNEWDDAVLISGSWSGTYPTIAVSGSFVHVVFFSAAQGVLLYARSDDYGDTWQDPVYLTGQVETNCYPALAVRGASLHIAWENGWTGANMILYKRSTDSGDTWTDDVMLSGAGSDATRPTIAATETHIHVAYQSEIGIEYLHSTDNGANWPQHSIIHHEGEHPSITASESLVLIVFSTNGYRIQGAHSADHGLDWEFRDQVIITNNLVADAQVTSYDNFFFLVWTEYLDGRLNIFSAVSTDGGKHFSPRWLINYVQENACRPHAALLGKDVHMIWTEDMTSTNQEIIYLKQPGLNALFNPNELAWGFAAGLDGNDAGNALELDSEGNIYVAGSFEKTVDFDPGPLVHNLTSSGSDDAFIAKYSAAGVLHWVKTIGGTKSDGIADITLDNNDNIYITGTFDSQADVDPGPSTHLLQSAGVDDVFIIKLDQDGNFIWASGMGGTAYDYANSIQVDHAGRVITVGNFTGTADFDYGPGQTLLHANGFSDAFVTIHDANGSLINAAPISGPGFIALTDISIDAHNFIFITGYFQDSVDLDPGMDTAWYHSSGGWDAYILKLNSEGQFVHAFTIGSDKNDLGLDIEFDATGNFYLMGECTGELDVDPGDSTYYIKPEGAGAAHFVLSLDTMGVFRWAHAFSLYEQGSMRMKLDAIGCIYLIGSYRFVRLETLFEDALLNVEGYDDVLMLKIDTSGHWMWISPLQGSGYSTAKDFALKDLTEIYVTGYFTQDLDLDPTAGVAHVASPGAESKQQMFLAKYNQCIPVRAAQHVATCQPIYTPDAQYLWESGTYRVTSPDETGCDSIITLHLTRLYPSPRTEVIVTACDTFIPPSGAFAWTHSATYFERLTNVAGCDSVVYYHVTIVESPELSMRWVEACNQYTTPDSQYTWTTSGTYEAHYFNVNGCDSVIIYDVMIHDDETFAYEVFSCETYTTPDGLHTWDSSGIYQYTVPTAEGCENHFEVHLEITSIDPGILTTDSSLVVAQGGAMYQWMDCATGALLAGENEISFQPSVDGQYAAIIELEQCMDTTACIFFTTVSARPGIAPGELIIYPNPAHDMIRLKHDYRCVQFTLTLCDVTGRRIHTADQGDCHVMHIPEGIGKGLYFLEVMLDGKKGVYRVVVE